MTEAVGRSATIHHLVRIESVLRFLSLVLLTTSWRWCEALSQHAGSPNRVDEG